MKPGVDYVGVACGAIILNEDNQVLLVKRSRDSKIFAGMWSRPGGAVEYGETVEEALKREVREEVNLDVEVVRRLDVTNDIIVEDGVKKHWIALGFLVSVVGGELKNMEPDKHEAMAWFSLNQLPDNLTRNTKRGINSFLCDSLA